MDEPAKLATKTTAQETAPQRNLITHAVLIGLTPLIPLPVVDDLAKSYFQRRMVRSLAEARGGALSEADVATLAEDMGGGCASGCLLQALIYPLKLIFRKIFYFLEWKRAVDVTSRAYHHGYLVDYALRRSSDAPSIIEMKSATEVRAAVEEVCRAAPIKPIESAVRASFQQSKNALTGAARLVAQAYKRAGGRRPDAAKVAQAAETVERQEEQEISGVAARLQNLVAGIPDEHFARLRRGLDARLGLAERVINVAGDSARE